MIFKTKLILYAFLFLSSLGLVRYAFAFSCGDNVTFNYKGEQKTYGTVTVGSQCWMDRNLGATKVATSYNDCATQDTDCSYGDYFQWGRLDDGHQKYNSSTTSTNSTTTQPGHNQFITESVDPIDWLATPDATLWQSSNYVNNPCPAGWHVPAQTEWATAMTTLGFPGSCATGSQCLVEAANSTLKLPAAGYRYYLNGSIFNKGSTAGYWSSSPQSTNAYDLALSSASVLPADSNSRADGFSVRCIQNASYSAFATQNLTIGDGATNPVTVTAATNNPVLNVAGDFLMKKNATFAGGSSDMTIGTDGTTNGDFTLESGSTWTAGSGKLILDGGDNSSNLVYFEDQNSTKQNMGVVQIGASPATTNLKSDMTASSLTVSAGDILNTKGWDVDIGTGGISVATGSPGGTINTTDTGGANYEGDGTIITDEGNFTIGSGGVFTKYSTSPRASLVKMDGGTTKTFTSASQDIGNFQLSTASTHIDLQDAGNFDNVTIDSNTTLDANNNNITVAGNWANSGAFTAGSGTVTLDGGAQQTLSGNMTTGTSSAFNTLAITNTSGTDSPDNDITSPWSPGIIFSADADATNYNITTQHVRVQYNNTSTYTFANIDWNGQASNGIYFRNSSGTNGTHWNLKVTGTQTAVSYINVSHSNAITTGGGEAIVAGSGCSSTNYDAGDNVNWTFGSGNVSISGTTNVSSGTVAVAFDNSLQSGKTGNISGGNWTIGSVCPTTGQIVTTWVDAAVDADKTTAVAKYSGSGDLTGMILNKHNLSIGGTGAQAVAITDLGKYDYATTPGDQDIIYQYSAGTLTLDPGNIFSDETLNIPNLEELTLSNQTINLQDAAITGSLTASGAATINVNGNWTNSGVFTPGTSTVDFKATSGTQTLNSGGTGAGKQFNNLTHSGGGTLQLSTNSLVVNGDFNLSAGTFNQGSSLNLSIFGNILLTSGGGFTKGTGSGTLILDGNAGGSGSATFEDQHTTKVDLGAVQIGASPGVTNLKSDMSATSLTINNGDSYNTHGWDVTLTDFLTCNGTLNATDEAPNNAGNPTIFTVGGNWTTSSSTGSFTSANSSVVFNSGATGKTIDSGGTGATKNFYDVQFNNSAGGWTIQTNDMKVGHNLTLTDVHDWTLASSRSLEVGGNYYVTDSVPAKTTFTGSTFYLNGTGQTIGSKTQTPENYGTLQIGANTDVKMWNSNAATYTVDSSGSLYSQNHNFSRGNLYIWGDYHTTGSDNWSAATDFNGDNISGSPRQAIVRIDPSANVTIDSGGTLNIVGTDSMRTDVSRQGASGGYNITSNSGSTINFKYANFNYLKGSGGLIINSGTTVDNGNFSNLSFDNLIDSTGYDSFVTVDTTVIGNNNFTFDGDRFNNAGGGANYNVKINGASPSGSWTFSNALGSFAGETYDGIGSGTSWSDEANPGKIIWSLSSTTEGTTMEGTIQIQGQAEIQ